MANAHAAAFPSTFAQLSYVLDTTARGRSNLVEAAGGKVGEVLADAMKALQKGRGMQRLSANAQEVLQHAVMRLCSAYAGQFWTTDERLADLEYLLPQLAELVAEEKPQQQEDKQERKKLGGGAPNMALGRATLQHLAPLHAAAKDAKDGQWGLYLSSDKLKPGDGVLLEAACIEFSKYGQLAVERRSELAAALARVRSVASCHASNCWDGVATLQWPDGPEQLAAFDSRGRNSKLLAKREERALEVPLLQAVLDRLDAGKRTFQLYELVTGSIETRAALSTFRCSGAMGAHTGLCAHVWRG